MKPFYLMNNPLQHYAWGSAHSIPNFTGTSVEDNTPVAELWMGAHPSAPSSLLADTGPIPLNDFISRQQDSQNTLPFLFKLLSAKQALSIQVHPDKQTAIQGFADEEQQNIPLHSPNRNYRDQNHKPEILMALEPFSLMSGFRSPPTIATALEPLQKSAPFIPDQLLQRLKKNDHEALKNFLSALLTLPEPDLNSLLETTRNLCHRKVWSSTQSHWVRTLLDQFPNDPGALSPLFLNVLTLSPWQALYQGAGTLHAYLQGFGLELMANSDNVLRGGLTSKHVDVHELLKILSVDAPPPRVLHVPEPWPAGQWTFFDTPAPDFSLGLFRGGEGKSEGTVSGNSGPLILLSLESAVQLSSGSDTLVLQKGQSAFIPRGQADIHLSCPGVLAMARSQAPVK